jgi:PAS domain S-box-containing protein
MDSPNQIGNHIHTFYTKAGKLLLGAVAMLGVLVLLGWLFNLGFLKSLLPGLVAMNPATAVCFILSALALYLTGYTPANNRQQSIGSAVAALVFTIGIVKLAGILTGTDVLVDSLLFSEQLQQQVINNLPNRMAPNTAAAFVFSSIAILLVNTRYALSQYVALLPSVLGMLSLLGYLYRVYFFYSVLMYIPMAIHTATGFLLLASAILLVHPGKGFMAEFTGRYVGAVTARKLIPAAILVPAAFGFIRLYSEWKFHMPVELGVALLILSIMVVFLALIWINARQLNRKDLLRREAEASLQKRMEEIAAFKSLFESAPGLYLILTPKLIIDAVSDEYLLATMTKREEIKGRYLFDVFPDNPEDTTADGVSNLGRSLQTVLQTKRPHTMAVQKYDIRRPDGVFEERYWSPLNKPVLNEAGEVVYIIHSVVDITERMRHEQEILRAEKRFRMLFESAPDALIMVDKQGVIQLLNKQAEVLFGYTKAQLAGQPVELLIPSSASGNHAQLRTEYVAHPTTRVMGEGRELKALRKDGSEVAVEISLAPIEGETKGDFLVLAAIRDITQKKLAEEQLKAVNKELESFSYSVSHDLRAPLRAINGYARMLIEDYETSLHSDGKRMLDTIMGSAKKMSQLIDDLLQFSRLSRRELEQTTISTQSMVEGICEEMKSAQPHRQMRFIIPPLPNVMADNMIKQVWINLLNNAVKYSSHRPESIIEVKAEKHPTEIVFSVTDNGAGFDMRYAGKLFGVFQRLHSEEEFEGTGVGLAIVQRVVNKHGGKVWAQGEVGKGATFSFSLPLA